jgi:chorismate mutase/prephenate dehydrogenase
MTEKPPRPLPDLRKEIRAIDDQIMRLVAQRLTLAREVGEAKLALDLPIKDFRVEKDVIEAARARAGELGVYPELAESLSKLLIGFAVAAQDEFHKEAKRTHTGPRKRVLIAGGRGHMGRWLTAYFESYGHEVAHLDQAGAPPAPQTLYTHLAPAGAQDVIVLSTPITATPGLITQLTAARSPALIFDISSLKTPLVPTLEAAARAGLTVTSVHPMFGPGATMLAGRNIIICQVDASPAATAASAAARALFADTTASIVEMPLVKHDELMSSVLGLSHLTSLAFAEALARSGRAFGELRAVASTTFNSQLEVTVPVTGEHQDLYYEIQKENRHTPEVIAGFAKALDAYRDVIARGDRDAFRVLMERGRRYLGGS